MKSFFGRVSDSKPRTMNTESHNRIGRNIANVTCDQRSA